VGIFYPFGHPTPDVYAWINEDLQLLWSPGLGLFQAAKDVHDITLRNSGTKMANFGINSKQ
jgi:hypothetical protein